MRTEIKSLENQIKNDSSNDAILEYVSKTGDLLVDYYESTSKMYNNKLLHEESDSDIEVDEQIEQSEKFKA